MENDLLSLEYPTTRFEKFLAIRGNRRILFSGRYGLGKTTCLKEYFESRPYSYNCIWLNPLRYSTSSDQDIISLIKYDIVYSILTHEDSPKSLFEWIPPIDSDTSLFPEWVFSEKLKYALALLPHLSEIDQSTVGLINAAPDLLKSIKGYFGSKGEEDKSSVLGRLGEFYSQIQSNPLFEIDVVNELVPEWCQAVSEQGKKSVLILDDLDRLDPKDLFRILNVLSAGLSLREDEVGFLGKFDHIVVVCDVGNVRHIFKHLYGPETDFGGYIDKFI